MTYKADWALCQSPTDPSIISLERDKSVFNQSDNNCYDPMVRHSQYSKSTVFNVNVSRRDSVLVRVPDS